MKGRQKPLRSFSDILNQRYLWLDQRDGTTRNKFKGRDRFYTYILTPSEWYKSRRRGRLNINPKVYVVAISILNKHLSGDVYMLFYLVCGKYLQRKNNPSLKNSFLLPSFYYDKRRNDIEVQVNDIKLSKWIFPQPFLWRNLYIVIVGLFEDEKEFLLR